MHPLPAAWELAETGGGTKPHDLDSTAVELKALGCTPSANISETA